MRAALAAHIEAKAQVDVYANHPDPRRARLAELIEAQADARLSALRLQLQFAREREVEQNASAGVVHG